MKVNFKMCSFTAAIAFVLSFFIALISGAGFGISLLRAIILAVCFGALSVGISFVYDKFLNEKSYDASSTESTSDSAPTIGNKVDITIDDEELQEDDETPKFVLTGQNQMLSSDDLKSKPMQVDNINEESGHGSGYSKTQTASSSAVSSSVSSKPSSSDSPAPAFKPVSLGQSSELETDELPAIENTLGDGSFLRQDSEQYSEDLLDVLPDMGAGTKAAEQTVTDSEFAVGGKTTSRLNEAMFPDGTMAESKDAVLMAEALRTVLKNGE
ncbi:hypothetical protein [Treponema sp.]|uniref:hypothetical protein n=1 Tax=Treponema sp. TaxID=166 RepID=UPI00298D7B3B|nr:hypothetical protein [Treponema sp.]